jgi:hypothetical protein
VAGVPRRGGLELLFILCLFYPLYSSATRSVRDIFEDFETGPAGSVIVGNEESASSANDSLLKRITNVGGLIRNTKAALERSRDDR